jgi:spermidine synthase
MSLWTLEPISAWIEQSQFASLGTALFFQGGVLALVTLPVTIVFGAWLPILARQVSGGVAGHADSGARLYGINSIGAAAGSLLAGFVLLPWLGTTQTMIIALLLLFGCGLYWTPQRRFLMWFVVPLLLLVWPVRDLPPVARLLPQTQADSRDVYRYEDAVSITHVVEQSSGQRLLLSDLQRMDASSEPAAVALQQNQAWPLTGSSARPWSCRGVRSSPQRTGFPRLMATSWMSCR